MSPLITLLTTTGLRPKAFALCEKYIARQTYKGERQWVVVDDSPRHPTICTMGQEYYVGPLEWKPGINTQRYSLNLALSKAKGDFIFIIEDDDYLKPEYLEVYMDFLKHADLVGECDVTYYSLRPQGFLELGNKDTCSTCQTAFRKSYIPHFYRALHSAERFFDITCWVNAKRAQHSRLIFSGLNLLIGMKGLPGRTGIGVGHQGHNFTPDVNFTKLIELIGIEDAKAYMEIGKK